MKHIKLFEQFVNEAKNAEKDKKKIIKQINDLIKKRNDREEAIDIVLLDGGYFPETDDDYFDFVQSIDSDILDEGYVNEAKLKPGRDEPIAKAIIAYFYAVEDTPEGDVVRNLRQHPIRSDINPKNHEMLDLGGWAKDAVRAISGARRVPGNVMLSNVIALAANNGKSYYFDGVDFVEGDKTIISRTDKMGFREFVDTLVKQGVVEAPKY